MTARGKQRMARYQFLDFLLQAFFTRFGGSCGFDELGERGIERIDLGCNVSKGICRLRRLFSQRLMFMHQLLAFGFEAREGGFAIGGARLFALAVGLGLRKALFFAAGFISDAFFFGFDLLAGEGEFLHDSGRGGFGLTQAGQIGSDFSSRSVTSGNYSEKLIGAKFGLLQSFFHFRRIFFCLDPA